jgi:acetoin utilization deacetylase AcuC-like enzyme
VPGLYDFRPELILFHVAGSGPYSGDRLSGLDLSKKGLKQRDRLVFTAARALGVPQL